MKKILSISLSSLAILLSLAGCNSSSAKFNKASLINVVSREEGSGTRGAFIEIFGIEKKDSGGKKVDYTTEEALITNSTAVMLTSVEQDASSIGYVSLGSLSDSIKALKIDGAEASAENILNSSYQISRPFNVAVKEDLSEAASDFLSYILSTEGQNIIAENKCIKLADSKSYQKNDVKGKVVISGSSSVSPVMEKLIEAYKNINPSVKIELQTSDSTTGITNAISGTCDIGMASRSLKLSEKEKGVKEITIALDGIALIVNKKNPLTDMTKAQVKEIFTGETTKWSQIIK